jgi:acetylornithine deacetylase/succinyl-diaminopimelate desuccinylase-like protein
MKTDSKTLQKAWSKVDEKELVELAMALVSTPSTTGSEETAAKLLVNWLNDRDIPAFYQEVEPGRGNMVGRLKGSGGGPILMFNGHLDTALSGDPQDVLFAGRIKPEWKAEARRVKNLIYGSGIVNDKGPLCCTLAAVHALKKSGVKFKGEIVLTGVCSEIGRAPIDQYQGAPYRGKGIGMRYMLTHGVVADYAIVVEPSRFGITWTQSGATFIKITVWGEPMYAPYVQHPKNLKQSQNAVIKMSTLIEPLEEWARQYEKAHTYKFEAGEVVPKVNIGAIMGGAPFKPNFSPGVCNLYVEAFTEPGTRPIDVLREVEVVVQKSGLEADIELYLSVLGYESKNAKPLAQIMRGAYTAVRKKPPKRIEAALSSTYADLNILVEMGVPAIKCGPAPEDPKLKPATGEVQKIEDLVDATKMYVAAALEVCNHLPKT